MIKYLCTFIGCLLIPSNSTQPVLPRGCLRGFRSSFSLKNILGHLLLESLEEEKSIMNIEMFGMPKKWYLRDPV